MSEAGEPGIQISQYGRVLLFLRPYQSKFVFLFLIGLVSTSLTLAQPYLTKLLIDDALLHRNIRGLWLLALWMAICTGLSFGLGLLTTRAYTKLSANVLFDMRSAVFRRLQCMSPQYFARTKIGDIVSRLNNDISELQRLSSDTLLSFPTNLLFLVGSAAMMAYLDLTLFLVSIALTPFGILAMRRYQGRLRGNVKELRERSAEIGSFLIEAILSMRLIVCSNAQERKNEEFRTRNGQFVDSLLKMQVTSFLAGALPGAVLTVSIAGLFLLGGSMVIRGTLTLGGLMAFMAYYSRLLSPVQSFMSSYSALVTGSVSLNRVFTLLDLAVLVNESRNAVRLRSVSGSMCFEQVSFEYENQEVLRQLSFTLAPRSVCVLVGSSGAGKSTVLDLLLRFYDPSAGRVLLDDIDLREIALADLRNAVAVVEQTPFLFHSTIRQNLLFAAPDSEKFDVEQAARAAGVHDFIISLPEQYETVVGERGLALSAGQRQRLAIARALLRKPSVLILDEPSAALDPMAEFLLGETLRSLAQSCTVLIVTHRPALVDIADHVIVLDQGRAVEQGSPSELRASNSEFARHFRRNAEMAQTPTLA